MSLTTAIAVYGVFWFITLFMVLPFGVRRLEDHERNPGEDPGAPANPRMALKCLITTGVAAVFFAIFYAVHESGLVGFRAS